MNKDFKVILPGHCNAHCSFCFWEPKPTNDNYLAILEETLRNATPDFAQLNVTGGEPTLSPYFEAAMGIIRRYKSKFPKVVLTTNGSNLWNVRNSLHGAVDHLNISRHHYWDYENMNIFGSSDVPNEHRLTLLCKEFNRMGIDVTLNSMVNNDWTKRDLELFVELTKKVGASYLVFRHDYSQGLHSSTFESQAPSKIVYSYNCDVCATNVRLIDGVLVSWKYGVLEPSDTVDDFEIILGQDGVLSLDYDGRKVFKFTKEEL